MSAIGALFSGKTENRPVGLVTNSVEFMRVFNLPRRVLDFSDVDDATPVYRREGSEMELWPVQSAALIEASVADGLFAAIRVGGGKTLIVLLLADAMDAKNAVILVRPDLKRQLEREIDAVYNKHFKIPTDRFTIVSYSELSNAKKASILEDIHPDLIICDECHALKNFAAARTKRFLRYAKSNPSCRLAFLSGTITTRSVTEYAHLLELALAKNSPLPRGYREVRDWAGALDVSPEYAMEPGILMNLCRDGEDVRSGYRRRLAETEGVVATEEGALGTSLIIRRCAPQVPEEISEMIEEVRATWSLGGEEFQSVLHLHRAVKQLSSGFYYRWVWPNGEPDYEWLEARADWHREVREKLKRSTAGFDSPLLLARAAERFLRWDLAGRPQAKEEWLKTLWKSETWERWRLVKDQKPPPTEAVWVNDFLVDFAADWATKNKGIVWYEYTALGERIATKAKLPLYGAGTDAGESKAPVIVCSIATQGTGKNLQRHDRNLFTTVPPNGTRMEQTLGRTHRPGQLSDEVVADWCGHTPELIEAMEKAKAQAEYMQETTGQKQKLLYAVHIE